MKNILLFYLTVFVTICSCNKTERPLDKAPTISSFTPDTLSAYNYVSIYGSNFDTVASKNLVAFNGLPATVVLASDSFLYVIAPQNINSGKITVTANNGTATSANSYFVLAGSWVQKANVPDVYSPSAGRAFGIGFSIGNIGYMGMGTDNGAAYNDLNAYDPVINKWTQKSSLPIGLESPVCMVINEKAYVGIGLTRNIGTTSNQFFEYDPVIDKWTSKADFPGTQRLRKIGIGLGNKGYAGLGILAAVSYEIDWWQYDPAINTWTRKSDFPDLTLENVVGFALNNKIYISGYTLTEPGHRHLWQYDPSTNAWTKKIDLPSYRLSQACSMIIENKAYLMGGQGGVYGSAGENWQYNEVTDTWVQKAFFGERWWGSAFTIGNKGYFGLGNDGSHFHHDFWEYTPD